MPKEFTAIFGTIIGSGTLIYNNERNIKNANKLAGLQYENDKQNNEVLSNIYTKLENLENKFNNIQTISEIDKLELKNLMNKAVKESLDDLNTIDVSKSTIFDIDSFISTVSEPGFFSFSICILLFSLITVSLTFGLISNYYFDKYGEQYKDKLPNWILFYIKVRKKFNNFVNKYYIIMILICQFMIILLSIYIKFRGIA